MLPECPRKILLIAENFNNNQQQKFLCNSFRKLRKMFND